MFIFMLQYSTRNNENLVWMIQKKINFTGRNMCPPNTNILSFHVMEYYIKLERQSKQNKNPYK